MQKDFHFYVTYALARMADIDPDVAATIAWADQRVDDVTDAGLYGIQTQCSLTGNWSDRQVQASVLVPFHFVPGDDAKRPWMVTPGSARARKLVIDAIQSDDVFRLGIALHALQDTYSHQGFSGWSEKLNQCYWGDVRAIMPDVGHAEMGKTPDVLNYVWTDPRTQERVVNVERAMDAAARTADFLAILRSLSPNEWSSEEHVEAMRPVFGWPDYEARKQALRELAGEPDLKYDELACNSDPQYIQIFCQAARAHLAAVMESLDDLPMVGA